MMNGTSTYRPLYAVHRGRRICVHANKLTNNNIKITWMTLKTVLNIVNMFEKLGYSERFGNDNAYGWV